MATYAIGDLQGCYETLQRLLDEIRFDRNKDKLWFVGDVVNRGPGSLACLRFVKSLGEGAECVLGNHDLHLVACAEGLATVRPRDTIDEILRAPDCDELVAWLRHRPLMFGDDTAIMVHAGIAPGWDPERARRESGFVASRLAGPGYRAALATMYGNRPDRWSPDLPAPDRFRFAVNAFTRMRCVAADGTLDFAFKGELEKVPDGLQPWFLRLHPSWRGITVLAGHWSALGVREGNGFVALDGGCVWGRTLAAYRLEDRTIFQVPCAESTVATGWD